MQRAYSVLTVKAVNEDERLIEGMATTPAPDRVGDVIQPMGAKFKLPLPLLWQHRSGEPVGHVEFAKATAEGIPFRARIATLEDPGELKDSVDKAWQAVKAGLVRGVSIGFREIKWAYMEEGRGIEFQEWEWLELSLVTIPANQEATITAIKSFDREVRGASARIAPPVRLLLPPGVSGASPNQKQSPPGVSGVSLITPKEGDPEMKTIAEQITALEATRVSKQARMGEVMQKSIDEGRSTDASERDEFDGLEQELEAIDGDLKRLRALERAAAAASRPVGEVRSAIDAAAARATTVTGGQHSPVVAVKHEEKLLPGVGFARFVACVSLGKGNLMQSVEIAKGMYGESSDLVGLLKGCVQRGSSVISKAAVAGASTSDSAWAGSLVPLYQRYAGDFVEYLRPLTIVGRLGQNGIPGCTMVPFNVNIAGQTAGGTGYWVGEGQPKPVTRAGFNNVNFGWAKIAAIMVQTEELFRLSSPNSETLLRDELAKIIVERMDIDFVDPNKAAVAGVSPASVTNGVTPINSTGNDADAIREDFNLLFAPWDAAGMSGAGAVFIMSMGRARRVSTMMNALGQPEFPTMSRLGGTILGVPVITSEYVTGDSNGDDIILMNAPDIWMADDGEVTIDASREASIQMMDNPTNDGVNGGNPVATTMVSLWQTNMIGLRAERFVNWQKRRSQAVQLLNNANWGDPGSS